MSKVLVLRPTPTKKDSEFIKNLNTVSQNDPIYEYAYFEDFNLFISEKELVLKIGDKSLEEYDLIYFRQWATPTHPFIVCIIANYLKDKHIKYVDNVYDQPVSSNKLFQTYILKLNNIPIPRTLFFGNHSNINSDIFEKLGQKVVMKNVTTSKGNDNYLVENIEEVKAILQKNKSHFYIFQEFIPNTFDFRVIVLGQETKIINKRTRNDPNSHLNNITQGATNEVLEVKANEDISFLANKAAIALNRNIAGVDIIKNSENGKLVVIEVNSTPVFSNRIETHPGMPKLNEYLKSLITPSSHSS